ncbi:hypothetical protein K3181_13340 [Qipengyuania sp. YG27]|uniref:Uncharacterized protein n=1 Tax=Qipengyuania mesophila TaxID=2867246 RepID=A0ABS7JXQ1_9SPHN|nr:hypothetical protein [Qipengyuania mesophila]MBX7502426.1 hypothetical protein [Qipengyuania mesophila]
MAGTNDDYLRRLKHDGRQDLIDKIDRGDISIYAAAIEMGYRKKRGAPSKADQISYHYSRATLSEKRRFIVDNWSSVARIVGDLARRRRANEQAQKPSE